MRAGSRLEAEISLKEENQYLKRKKLDEDLSGLHYIHTSSTKFLDGILQARALKGAMQSDGEQRPLYFFYGVPAYVPAIPEKTFSSLQYMPIVFVIKKECLDKKDVASVFPFDTGAIKRGLYKDCVSKETEHNEHFLLHGNIGLNTKKLIAYFFNNSLNNYYDCKKFDTSCYSAKENNYEVCKVIEDVHRLINPELDDRKRAIEVALNEPLDINSENILAVIAPDDLDEDDKTKVDNLAQLAGLSEPYYFPLAYKAIRNIQDVQETKPYFIGPIKDIVRNLYVNEGLLD